MTLQQAAFWALTIITTAALFGLPAALFGLPAALAIRALMTRKP
jgi:hypothetical protein